MYLDTRNWQIPDTEPVGSKITQVHGSDTEGGPLHYDLELIDDSGTKQQHPHEKLPFRIDSNTGTVYLNESLKGRVSIYIHRRF